MATGSTQTQNREDDSFVVLNRFLMRFILQEPGSPGYAICEGELVEAVRRTVGMHLRHRFPQVSEDDLDAVYFELLLRWRCGLLTTFTRWLVQRILYDQWRRARPGRLDPECDPAAQQLDPAQRAALNEELQGFPDRARQIRASLPEPLGVVFDAQADDGEWGWQSRLAQRQHRSNAWVSHQASVLANLLTESHGIQNCREFFRLIRLLRPDAEPAGPDPHLEPVEEHLTSLDPQRAEILRQRLLAHREEVEASANGNDAAFYDRLNAIYIELGRQLNAEEPSPVNGPTEDVPPAALRGRGEKPCQTNL